MKNYDKERKMRDFRKAARYLKTILKLEDILEEHEPYLFNFKVLLICCMCLGRPSMNSQSIFVLCNLLPPFFLH